MLIACRLVMKSQFSTPRRGKSARGMTEMIDGVAVVAPAAYATASIRNECAQAFLCSNLSTAYLNNVSRALRIFFGLFLPVVLMLSRTGIGRNSV